MNGFIKKIEQINFGLMSPEDIREMSVVTVETPDTYEDDGFPIEKGLMDPRLGVIDPSLVCRTCGFRGGDCQGHFGSIELARPVIHIGFGDVIHKILRSTCNSCGRVLLPENVLEEYTKKITEAMENKESISEILKKLQNETKKVEMSDAKQNDIIDKIMKEVYPEGEDNYDDADREDILLNILDELYAEAYMERDETEEKPQFKYIDPKQLCPHCKKNQSLADIEASYEMIEAKNADDLHKLHDKIIEDVEEDYWIKIAKIDKKIEMLHKRYEDTEDYIAELEEEKTDILAEAEEKTEDKVQKEFKRRLRDFVKQYLQELIQEPILLDKPVTIRQGDYKLTAFETRQRLENITDYDSFVLGVNPEVARPEWLVLTVLPVPPVTVRPSITLDTGERSEDDLTHKLVDILRINQRLLENMEAGAPQLIVEDLWELLQYHVTTYFDNEASGVPPARHRSGRPLKTLTQRLKGKEGRFRSNLSGKRVNFSARTVISPDPNITINEVGVPEMIAKEVTVPVYVTDFNIEKIKIFVKNGVNRYPGATKVLRNDGRLQRIDLSSDTEYIAENLQPGYVVERNLMDGDIVLLNRQPSLHKYSMMSHKVKILPYKTFRINPCVCPPYNADFDGDEMNMHIVQSVESRAEIKSMLMVQENILSSRFGGPIIGAIHDHISGAFILTREGSEFSEEEALQIIRKSHIKMPIIKNDMWILKHSSDFNEESFIYKEKGEKWTGKELFSLLLPNDLNLAYANELSKGNEQIIIEEFDEKSGKVKKRMGYENLVFPTDGYVVIKNGILEQGVIDQSAIGSFDGKILDKIVKEYGSKRAQEFLNQTTLMSICAIMKTGITTSLNDEEIPEEAQIRIIEQLDEKIAEVDELVESYEEGYLQVLPGRSLEGTLEMKIMQVLDEARDFAGKIAESYILNRDNTSLFSVLGNNAAVMAKSGARASMLNLTQVTACVGQQSVRGARIERGYLNRTLPHFKKGELGAKAKGFVCSSYKSGLDPIEFFFHAMGGREGLVDTAIRTAQSGYMQRRLVNALQDLHVNQLGVVSDNEGNVIQILYGEDGVDPAKSDFGKPADLNKLIEEIRLDKDDKLYTSNHVDQTKFKNKHDDNIKIIEEKFEISDLNEKRNELYTMLYNIITNLNEDYLNNYGVLKDLKNNVTELQGLLFDKKNMLEDIKSIENEIVKYSDMLLEYKNKIIKYNSIKSDSIEEIDSSISKINEIHDDFYSIEWPNFENKLNELQESYELQLNNENSLNKSEDIEQLISELNKTFNHPFISHDLRKFNLAQEELESIKNIIIEDIVNKKITGTNLDFKSILISYCEEFTKECNALTDDELDEILSKVDLSNIDESIVKECKSKVKKDYESNEITINQIPIKFNKHLNKKLDEIKKLEELEEIKNNPNLPEIKQYLSREDCILIYIHTEEEICSEYGLRMSVLNFIEIEMYRKNEKNKSEAREEFKRYRYNKNYFLNLTNLKNHQVESFVRDVELLIDDNKIKTKDFDEEFIQKLSLSFITYGNVIL